MKRAVAAAANLSMSDMRELSPFELFGLAPQYRIDAAALESAYQSAISKVHPDRFANRSAAEKRVAEQWSARINEAHAILADPVRRAEWFCTQAGFPLKAESNTAMPEDFLMDQMQKRETLEKADGLAALKSLGEEARRDAEALVEKIAKEIDDDRNWQGAVENARRLMFVNRFMSDVAKRTAKFDD